MERLTTRIDGHAYYKKGSKNSCTLKDMYTALIERLAEYEDAEEQGLLIRLPCRDFLDIIFGDQTVFWGIDTAYLENPIREITVDNSERITWYDGWKSVVINGSDENGFGWEFKPEDIGNTVFLTREEAVRKFKETNGGKIK